MPFLAPVVAAVGSGIAAVAGGIGGAISSLATGASAVIGGTVGALSTIGAGAAAPVTAGSVLMGVAKTAGSVHGVVSAIETQKATKKLQQQTLSWQKEQTRTAAQLKAAEIQAGVEITKLQQPQRSAIVPYGSEQWKGETQEKQAFPTEYIILAAGAALLLLFMRKR